jgi:hypothetical protein
MVEVAVLLAITLLLGEAVMVLVPGAATLGTMRRPDCTPEVKPLEATVKERVPAVLKETAFVKTTSPPSAAKKV